MTAFPVCSGTDAIRAFERNGWKRARQHGSHVTLVKSGSPFVLTVSLASRARSRIAARSHRKAGISVDDFLRSLR
jgi:predicted RNA binding protein YcfA (HicA-like mRNA interferase family)